MQEIFGIAAFRSRQQVLRFETALRREGLMVNVISTPRDVALGCGLSVRFRIEDARTVQRAVEREKPGNMVGLYRVERTGARTKLTVLALRP